MADVARMCGGEMICHDGGELEVRSVCTDSREATAGCVFAAISGARSDGASYVAGAAERGAVCAIAQRIDESTVRGSPVILVEDTPAALLRLAAAYDDRVGTTKNFRVAVTGSVGKTTTKEFIAAVLGASHTVYRTEGNYNSVIGMPLTLMGMGAEAETAVFELGMGARGDVSAMSRVLRPDIAVITNIGTSHLEALGTRENIAAAKLEIVEGLAEHGKLLLCGGEPLLANVADPRVAYFSTDEGDDKAQYRAINVCRRGDATVFDVVTPRGRLDGATIPAIGKHNVAAALCAIAVGQLCGMKNEDILGGLLDYRSVGLRQCVKDIGGVRFLADCYNAAPESMRASAEVLGEMAKDRGGRRIAVLGDMLELGADSRALHAEVGRYFACGRADTIYTFGTLANDIASSAEPLLGEENVARFSDVSRPEDVARRIRESAREGDVVLVKASRAIAAERIIDAFESIKK